MLYYYLGCGRHVMTNFNKIFFYFQLNQEKKYHIFAIRTKPKFNNYKCLSIKHFLCWFNYSRISHFSFDSHWRHGFSYANCFSFRNIPFTALKKIHKTTKNTNSQLIDDGINFQNASWLVFSLVIHMNWIK